MKNVRDNPNSSKPPSEYGCHVCKDLLANMQRFIDMVENARKASEADWLTVEEIAKELKISRSVVYRLIRNGELEAVDLVDADGKMARKGHYRVTRSSLNQFLESKKVRPLTKQVTHSSHLRRQPKVKNHLGL